MHPEFFKLRPAGASRKEPEKYLSAFYYEFFDGLPAQKMNGCTEALPFIPAGGDAMVRLDAQAVRMEGKSHNTPLRVLHEESHPTIPSKAQIAGLTQDMNQQLTASLATKTVVEICPVLKPNV